MKTDYFIDIKQIIEEVGRAPFDIKNMQKILTETNKKIKEYVDSNTGSIDLSNYVTKDRVKTDVPANAKFTDTVYTHPSKHEASDITETSTKRFVSDMEKTKWNAKLETSDLTPLETSISDLSGQLGDIISRLEALETPES